MPGMQYVIHRATATPELQGLWDGPAWREAAVAEISSFHPASSDHRPVTEAKVLHDDAGLYVHFRCIDRYVICRKTRHQTITSRDSCVEVYFEPAPGKGYLNFEMNCGGALLLFYITDPTRAHSLGKPVDDSAFADGIFKQKVVVPQSLIDTMRIYHSMPRETRVEITEPVIWNVEYFIPYTLVENYVGAIDAPTQRRWRGNFFKCADDSSHPHWASWAPIGEELNFHVPRYFGEMKFE
jgi:hypothetical protein